MSLRLFRVLLAGLAVLLLSQLPATAGPFPPNGRLHVTRGIPNTAGVAPIGTPTLLPGSGPSNVFNTIAPTNAGNPADYGYNLPGIGRWDDYQLVEIGHKGVATTRHIGLLFAHAPTDAELAAGTGSNICQVQVRGDSGTYVTVFQPTANPDAGGYTDWNVIVNNWQWPDGLHRVDAIGVPCTGPNIIMEGPFENSGHFVTAATGQNGVSDPLEGGFISGAAPTSAGHILTLTFGANFQYGWSVEGLGVAPNTFIDGTSTVNATKCVAETGSNCTGAGGAGTYYVTVSQVAGNPITASITNGVLNVSALTSGLMIGDYVNGAGVTSGTRVVTPSFTGSTSGTTLTVSVVSTGALDVGFKISGTSVPTNTTITALGTGTGGVGTYTLSTSSSLASETMTATGTGGGGVGKYGVSVVQTVASEAMTATVPITAGDYKSFYFLTDYNGTLGRTGGTVGATQPITYVCPAGSTTCTGSDSNNGLTAATPKLNVLNAVQALSAMDTNASKGMYGGVVCEIGGGPITTNSGTLTNNPSTTSGWLVFEGGTGPDCNVAGDPGNPAMTFNSTTRQYAGTWHTFYKNLIADGGPTTLNPASAAELGIQNVTTIGIGINQNTGNNSGVSSGGYYCLESNAYIVYNGCLGGALIRNFHETYGSEDCFHGPLVIIASSCEGFGPNWNFPMQGTATNGQVDVHITTLPTIAGVPANLQTLSRWFTPGTSCASGPACISMQNGCMTSAIISSVDNAAMILHTGAQAATCSGTSNMSWGASQPHGDNMQLASGTQGNDAYQCDNNYNPTYPSDQQGQFIETIRSEASYFCRNHYRNSGTVEWLLTVNGPNDNFIQDQNIFSNGTGSAGNRLDFLFPSTNETLNQDQCTSGQTFTGSSVPTRRKSASTNACY